MELKKIPNDYRPVPFWSWNDELDKSETKRQVRIMSQAGLGGFFMHARGGLKTEYLGREWFENISAAKDEAKKCGMYAWAYDENGWPSGFGDGAVNGIGEKYQQKYLRMSNDKPQKNIICHSGDKWFYYDVNPYYVDNLDKEVVAEFIKNAYQPYYDRYKNEITGFFTDEPQISRDGIPWSFVFEGEYFKRYAEDITEHLEELFLPISNYKETRIKFWKMVTELFSEAFFKQIFDWCKRNSLKLTGHLVLEESLLSQLTTNGACMPHYEYFSIPGVDWLGRKIYDCLTARQVSSVAQQLGKKHVLTESFALCGHNVSFDELKGIYEWQAVRGINLLCQHLEGYSLRGIRKRDYPPAVYYQQPWWGEYKYLMDALSREGMISAIGKSSADILVIHPQTTAWSLYDNNKNDGLDELNDEFLSFIKKLEEKHVMFHLGDEIILERHARVDGNKIIVGNQTYSCILNPCGRELLQSTKKLLKQFSDNGGKLDVDIAENNVIDRTDIMYSCCEFDGIKMHFFVNSSAESKRANINVIGKKFNIFTGEFENFTHNYEFEPWGSLIIAKCKTEKTEERKKTLVYLPDNCKVENCTENILVLDRCDYYFDGVIQEKNGYVLNIAERANRLERKVNIKQCYFVNAEYVPDEIYLVCETPEIFSISVNGQDVESSPMGYFCDKSFKKIDISGLLHKGKNVIEFISNFMQSNEFYKKLKKAYEFEGEKNKLAYDMEIEAVCLIGDFGVRTDGVWEELSNNAHRYCGEFVLTKPNKTLSVKSIEKQGFPFFCGRITIEAEINIAEENPALRLERKGINVVKIRIGTKEKVLITGNEINLNDFAERGKTTVHVTLINNLRNMLGPHHLAQGECFAVSPKSFYKEKCVWRTNHFEEWDDSYCFAEMSI